MNRLNGNKIRDFADLGKRNGNIMRGFASLEILDGGRMKLLAVLLCALGLALLFFSLNSEYKVVSVSQVKGLPAGEKIFLSGLVEQIEISENGGKISLCDSYSCISASFGKEVYNPAFLSKGGIARVWGRVREYRNGKFLEAEKVERG